MPIRVRIGDVEATYNAGEWECEDEVLRGLLETGTRNTIEPHDPEGEEGVRAIVGFMRGEIVERTPAFDGPKETGRIY